MSQSKEMVLRLWVTWFFPPIPSHPVPPSSLPEAFLQLDPALQQICGNITFPSDNGQGILETIKSNHLPLYGSSNASLKEGRASHAWYLLLERLNIWRILLCTLKDAVQWMVFPFYSPLVGGNSMVLQQRQLFQNSFWIFILYTASPIYTVITKV